MTSPRQLPAEGLELLVRASRPANAYEETMERLLQSVRLGLIGPGERLPSERDLAAMLKVSRDTVREALSTLAEAGYVESRRGRYGGTFVAPELPTGATNVLAAAAVTAVTAVTAQDAGEGADGRAGEGASEGAGERNPNGAAEEAASDSATAVAARISLDAAADAAELEEVAALRRVLEVGAAREAAARDLTADERATLSHALEVCRAASDADHRRLDSRLHLIIAELSGAPTLVPAVANVRTRVNALLDRIPMLRPNLVHSDGQHAVIVGAILAGRPDAAAAAMLEHVEGSTALLRGFFGR